MKFTHFIYLIAILWLGASLSGCSQKVDAEDKGGGAPMMATNVVAAKAEQKDLSDTLSLVGTLKADEAIDIKSEITGVISRINFKEGQRVHVGDVLMTIESEKLKASYDQAVANLKLAKTTATRYQTLVQSKAVSQQEYDEASAALDANEAAVVLAKEQLDDATIIAPFTGVMGERLVSIGQFITQGTPLSFLYNLDRLKVEFPVPERFLSEIHQDQVVQMRVAAYPDQLFDGKVYFVDPEINDMTRTVLVKAYVENKDGKLRSGMFANVNLIVSVSQKAVVIPETALIVRGDDVLVYVVKEDDTVEMRTVTVGKRLAGQAVIKEGLNKDEVVVTEGYQKIGPGSKVNVRFEDANEKKVYEII